jgi:hypothetical protein
MAAKFLKNKLYLHILAYKKTTKIIFFIFLDLVTSLLKL